MSAVGFHREYLLCQDYCFDLGVCVNWHVIFFQSASDTVPNPGDEDGVVAKRETLRVGHTRFSFLALPFTAQLSCLLCVYRSVSVRMN